MKHIPMKLGPLALLLTVVSICMTVLGILSFTTARADLSLARRYSDTVRLRYELEAEGQSFLGEAQRALAMAENDPAALSGLNGTETGEDGVVMKIINKNGFTLTIGIVPDEKEGLRVVNWNIQKDWEPNEDIGNLWSVE